MTSHLPCWPRANGRVRASAEAGMDPRRYMPGVYRSMGGGLALTSLVAYFGTTSGFHASVTGTPLLWIMLLAPPALVFFLSGRIQRMSLAAAVALAMAVSPALADDSPSTPSQNVVSHGLNVYLGVVPAEIAKGIEKGHAATAMHQGAAQDKRSYHIMAAVFNAVTGERITDAAVTASVSRTGEAAQRRPLEPMMLANAVTYGNFFEFPGDGIYHIRLSIARKESPRPVQIDFLYDRHAHEPGTRN